MELTQTKPLSIVILQDGTRLFAEAEKEKIKKWAETKEYIEIQGNVISTVKGNIRTIRDPTDPEYYEFFILDKLPPEVMEKMHSTLGKIQENKTKVSLLSLLNYQKKVEDELSYTRGEITPEQKENRRKNVIRMNEILVSKGFMTQGDADRIIEKILTNTL